MALYEGTHTEGRHDAAYLISEVGVDLSREILSIPANTPAMEPGTVLNVTGTDVAPFAAGNTDLAILFSGSVLDAANAQDAVVTRHLSVVNESDLVWPAGITQPDKDAAIAAFATNYVRVKTPVGPIVSGALS